VDYWKTILVELQESFPTQAIELLEGFWPTLDWKDLHGRTKSNREYGKIDTTTEDE
jgi:hypothetical protein